MRGSVVGQNGVGMLALSVSVSLSYPFLIEPNMLNRLQIETVRDMNRSILRLDD